MINFKPSRTCALTQEPANAKDIFRQASDCLFVDRPSYRAWKPPRHQSNSAASSNPVPPSAEIDTSFRSLITRWWLYRRARLTILQRNVRSNSLPLALAQLIPSTLNTGQVHLRYLPWKGPKKPPPTKALRLGATFIRWIPPTPYNVRLPSAIGPSLALCRRVEAAKGRLVLASSGIMSS